MIRIGEFNEMETARFTASGAYLKSEDGQETLLPRKFVHPDLKIGDQLRVFIFTDSEDRLTATTQIPKASVGEFAYLQVVDINSYGAFMDWGLDKDLMVPFSEQHEKMENGQKYIVRISLDYRTNRLIGISRIRDFFKKDLSELKVGQEVKLMIAGFTDLGIKGIIDNQYEGLLYANEVFEPLSMGEQTKGYIKRIREDGKIDLTLYKQGMERAIESGEVILERLRQSGGFLPYHDKTPPDVISANLNMSKKTFKKAVGGLYKSGSIRIDDSGITLVEG